MKIYREALKLYRQNDYQKAEEKLTAEIEKKRGIVCKQYLTLLFRCVKLSNRKPDKKKKLLAGYRSLDRETFGEDALDFWLPEEAGKLFRIELEVVRQAFVSRDEFTSELERLYKDYISLFSGSEFARAFLEEIADVVRREVVSFNSDDLEAVFALTKVGKRFAKSSNSYLKEEMIVGETLLTYFSVRRGEKRALYKLIEEEEKLEESEFLNRWRERLEDKFRFRRQVEKFRHDADQTISYLEDKLKRFIRRYDQLSGELWAIYDLVAILEGVSRLIRQETPQFEFVDPAQVAEPALELFPQLDGGCLITFGEKKEFELDRNYLLVALINLLKNSLDAYKQNQVNQNNTPVEVVIDYDKGEISVRDQAGGIPEELQEEDKLFSPLGSTKDSQEGGLGLVQVKQAVKLMEAKLSYETDSQGTQFIISFAREG